MNKHLFITDKIDLEFLMTKGYKQLPAHICQVMADKKVSYNFDVTKSGCITIYGVKLQDVDFWITLING